MRIYIIKTSNRDTKMFKNIFIIIVFFLTSCICGQRDMLYIINKTDEAKELIIEHKDDNRYVYHLEPMQQYWYEMCEIEEYKLKKHDLFLNLSKDSFNVQPFDSLPVGKGLPYEINKKDSIEEPKSPYIRPRGQLCDFLYKLPDDYKIRIKDKKWIRKFAEINLKSISIIGKSDTLFVSEPESLFQFFYKQWRKPFRLFYSNSELKKIVLSDKTIKKWMKDLK